MREIWGDAVVSQFKVSATPKCKWFIDYFVKSVDLYVQFDGEFWHGHLHSFVQIQELAKTQRIFRSIMKNVKKDNAQDIWFAKNGMRLIRISECDLTDKPALVSKLLLSVKEI